MTSLNLNYDTLKVSGICDLSQIQHITEPLKIQSKETIPYIPTMQTVLDPKGDLLNVNCCQTNFNLITINTKGNIVELK
jgi:hypothetical protein